MKKFIFLVAKDLGNTHMMLSGFFFSHYRSLTTSYSQHDEIFISFAIET